MKGAGAEGNEAVMDSAMAGGAGKKGTPGTSQDAEGYLQIGLR